jgi:electron transfer flavoprotein alpha subunit
MSGRQRVDPRQRLSGRSRTADAAAPAKEAMRRVEGPTCLIGLAASLDRGRLGPAELSALTAARRIADDLGAALVLLLLLAEGEALRAEPAQLGIDRLLILRHAAFAEYDPQARAAAIVAATVSLPLRHIVFADALLAGGDLGRRVAALLDDRPATGVIRWAEGQVDCRQDGGRSDVTRPAPRVLIIAPGAFPPMAEAGLREARLLPPVAWRQEESDLRDAGLLPFDPAAVPIDEAELVVSAGNGMTDWASFHALAAQLGAAEAGSRAAVDAGHLPRSRQVGASGQLIAPACYIALGIAGASQHLQGIARCQRVVAVNTDLHAEMIRRADLAIVADAQAVMPALLRRLRNLADG